MKPKKSPAILIVIAITLLVVVASTSKLKGNVGTPEELSQLAQQEQQEKMAREQERMKAIGESRTVNKDQETASLADEIKKELPDKKVEKKRKIGAQLGMYTPYQPYIFAQAPTKIYMPTDNNANVRSQWYQKESNAKNANDPNKASKQ
jgi:hypothetical protein